MSNTVDCSVMSHAACEGPEPETATPVEDGARTPASETGERSESLVASYDCSPSLSPPIAGDARSYPVHVEASLLSPFNLKRATSYSFPSQFWGCACTLDKAYSGSS
jgi:hypothetical protein